MTLLYSIMVRATCYRGSNIRLPILKELVLRELEVDEIVLVLASDSMLDLHGDFGKFAKVNTMEITVTISDDPANASEAMKQYL